MVPKWLSIMTSDPANEYENDSNDFFFAVVLICVGYLLLANFLMPTQISNLKAGIAVKTAETVLAARVGIALTVLKLSDSSEDILKEMSSPIVNFLIMAFPSALIKAKEEGAMHASDLDAVEEEDERFVLGWKNSGGTGFHQQWTQMFVPSVVTELGDHVTIKRIREDSYHQDILKADEVMAKLTKSTVLYPIEDNIVHFKNPEEANLFIKDCKLTSFDKGGCAPNTYNTWGDKTSDESLSRFFFHGLGATMLEYQTGPSTRPDLGPIEISMDFMTEFEVREGFRPYGATLYFDNNQNVTAIFDSHKKKLVKPGDDAWESTKFLAKSSGLAISNIRKHLLETHLTAANQMAYASAKYLPPNHPIRRLLNVFTFNTHRVNDGAMQILITERGLLHRFTAFSKMNQVFDSAKKANNLFQPFPTRYLRPELIKQSSLGKLPFHKEGCEYYAIVEKFVKAWVKESGSMVTDKYAQDFYNDIKLESIGCKYELPEFSKSAMIDLLAAGIFGVTAWHELTGNLIDYTNDPFAMGGRVVDGATSSDVQGFAVALLVTAATGGTVPVLMAKYRNYFGMDGAPQWERLVWDDFQLDLTEQSKCVSDRESGDTKRKFEFKLFNPENFEASVSV